MGSRTKKEVERQLLYTQQEYNYYYSRVKLLATNMFEWKGIDEWNIPEWYIESKLFEQGKLALYFDRTKGLICLPYSAEGTKTIYGESTKINLHGVNFNKTVNRSDVILLRNNKMELPTTALVNPFVRKLCETSRTIDTNIYLQKLSKIVLVDDKQRMTVENLLMQHEGNVPLIMADKMFKNVMETSNDKTIDLSVEFKALRLMDAKSRQWRELMETLGINSANTEKRERLLTGEVDSNNELNETATDVFLAPRQECCNLANEKWKKQGVFLSVERRNKIEYHNDIERDDSNGL